jgi:UDP-N-acetylmuramoylalanine--D-glutamate ligase
MINYKKYFEGKRVTKQGFGVLGRGYGVVKFLLESGAEVLVTDMKDEEFFKEQTEDLKNFCKESGIDFNKVTWRLGEHRLEDFEGCDFVIQASGVPKDNIYLAHAKSKNVPVYQEASLFAEIVREFNEDKSKDKQITLVGVTGTRGKTTTTFLIKAILDAHVTGLNRQNGIYKKVYFGGNVQGVATLENLKFLKGGDFVVMELDSWVLQGFGDIRFSPHVAVFTTFMPDHMNYYKGDMQEYFLDKANIFEYQKSGDLFVATEQIEGYIKKYMPNFVSQANGVIVNDIGLAQDEEAFTRKIIGKHNQIPVSLAIRAARALGADEEIIKSVVENFRGVKGRLELIKEVGGIKIYNDTTATTGDAAAAAVQAVEEVLVTVGVGGKIVLITGGRDKELDMAKYLDTLQDVWEKDLVREIIFLQDETTTGTNRVLKEKEESVGKYSFAYVTADSLEKAVELAKGVVQRGDVVILSPGFASFGMFQNEYDRGDRFVAAVKSDFGV